MAPQDAPADFQLKLDDSIEAWKIIEMSSNEKDMVVEGLGDEISYPVLWEYEKPILRVSLLNKQYFMERKGPRCFFLGISCAEERFAVFFFRWKYDCFRPFPEKLRAEIPKSSSKASIFRFQPSAFGSKRGESRICCSIFSAMISPF